MTKRHHPEWYCPKCENILNILSTHWHYYSCEHCFKEWFWDEDKRTHYESPYGDMYGDMYGQYRC